VSFLPYRGIQEKVAYNKRVSGIRRTIPQCAPKNLLYRVSTPSNKPLMHSGLSHWMRLYGTSRYTASAHTIQALTMTQ
jgi:hypothetical protein